MIIAIGSDHGGYLYKEEVKKYIEQLGHKVIDMGTNSTESCDYPIYAKKVANAVVNKEADKGVLVCTSGEGVSITANKIKGIRCGLAYNDEVARLIVCHNDANVIALGAKYSTLEEVKNRVKIFLEATFEGGRHQRRVDQIESK